MITVVSKSPEARSRQGSYIAHLFSCKPPYFWIVIPLVASGLVMHGGLPRCWQTGGQLEESVGSADEDQGGYPLVVVW